MTDVIDASPTDKRVSYNVKFTSGAEELGLILCDGYGRPNPNGIRQGKMPNRSLQISQGDPNYSDMELPYTPITQKDFSGGRGQDDFEKDTSRYADSSAIDGISGSLVLGPKATRTIYSSALTNITRAKQDEEGFGNPFTGYKDSWYNPILPPPDPIPADADGIWHIRLDDSAYYHPNIAYTVRATRFQWTGDGDLAKVKLWLANTNLIQISLFALATVDISTDAARKALRDAIIYGTANSTYGITNVSRQTFAVTESETVVPVEFDFNANMTKNAYYVLAVTSKKAILYPQDMDFVIPFKVGTNNTASTLEIRALKSTSIITLQPDGLLQLHTTDGVHQCLANSGDSLAFEMTQQAKQPGGAIFFDLKGTKFLVTSPSDGSAPRLFYEGYHGFAADNTATKDRILSINIGAEAVGANVKIISGPGAKENIRWRTIQSVVTGGSGYCVVDYDWNIIHTTATEFAIYGTGVWQEITGHGLTGAVTDVVVANGIVYFAQGDAIAIRRMRMVQDSRVWKPEYSDETGTYATYLELIQNESGVQKIWRALSAAAEVSSSDVKAWGAALAFGTAIVCKNTDYRITGIVAYGNPRIPWIMKEDGFGAVSNNIYDQVPLNEFKSVSDDNNGRASMQRGVYLYLSMLNGLERYYDGRLDDIGPNRDLGFPNNRNGQVSALLPYPGRMYAAIDHPTGYSSILEYNDIGWHEIYRTSLRERIYSMSVQVIDGDKCDRLWIANEGGYTWLPIAIDPKKQGDYTYTTTGEIITSWYSGNFKEIIKYFSAIHLYTEGLSIYQYLNVYYQTDTESETWSAIPTQVNTSPVQKILFPEHAVTGKRIRLKIVFNTIEPLKTPRLKALTISVVTRLPIKKSWSMTYRVDDNLFDLQHKRSSLTADQLQAKIEEYADSARTPAPLYMEAPHLLFSGKYVFIEPDSLRPIEWVYSETEKKFIGIGTLTVYEEES